MTYFDDGIFFVPSCLNELKNSNRKKVFNVFKYSKCAKVRTVLNVGKHLKRSVISKNKFFQCIKCRNIYINAEFVVNWWLRLKVTYQLRIL